MFVNSINRKIISFLFGYLIIYFTGVLVLSHTSLGSSMSLKLIEGYNQNYKAIGNDGKVDFSIDKHGKGSTVLMKVYDLKLIGQAKKKMQLNNSKEVRYHFATNRFNIWLFIILPGLFFVSLLICTPFKRNYLIRLISGVVFLLALNKLKILIYIKSNVLQDEQLSIYSETIFSSFIIGVNEMLLVPGFSLSLLVACWISTLLIFNYKDLLELKMQFAASKNLCPR